MGTAHGQGQLVPRAISQPVTESLCVWLVLVPVVETDLILTTAALQL